MRTRLAAAVLALALGAAGCNGNDPDTKADDPVVETTAAETPTPTAAVASHDTPDGAMNGLLDAMRSGDNEAVLEWVSPEPEGDRASITQTQRMQGMLGLDGTLFWEVGERHVVGVTPNGEDAADVALDGYLVWCAGAGPDDEKASCAQPNGSGDTQTTTYPAVRVDGQWYVHLDLNHGELIQGNPGAAGVAA